MLICVGGAANELQMLLPTNRLFYEIPEKMVASRFKPNVHFSNSSLAGCAASLEARKQKEASPKPLSSPLHALHKQQNATWH
ncbi:hypothetical protein EVAR_72238_1 [Eumeta japonica]|uniref:Uncharacterized protein n=1 Tax=Eumeta variegata TaxID=151549 RepID=A0A4C1TKU6_EUMVA|nr:hypothetical protein EVAR_72238_1 [Eumeta japonica]